MPPVGMPSCIPAICARSCAFSAINPRIVLAWIVDGWIRSSRLAPIGVPRPVHGSAPVRPRKAPLLPCVTSLKQALFKYNVGVTKPSSFRMTRTTPRREARQRWCRRPLLAFHRE